MKQEIHPSTKRKVLEFFKIYADDIIKEDERKKHEPSKDTLDRREVHKVIQQMLREGKGKIEILNYLSNTYPDAQCSKYFGQWIDYYYQKQNNIKPEKIVESEER